MSVALLVGPPRGALAMLAFSLAEAGWAVALGYPSGRADAAAVVEALRVSGATAVAIHAGAIEEGTGQILVRRTREELGRIDAVVLDCEPPDTSGLEQLDLRLLPRYLDAEVLGAHRIARAVVPSLRESGGRIVVIARGGGPAGGLEGGARLGWAAAVAPALAADGVAVGCVAIGIEPRGLPLPGVPAALVGEQGLAHAVAYLLAAATEPGARIDVEPDPDGYPGRP